MKIAIGSDHKGLALKKYLASHLKSLNFDVIDVTSNEDDDLFDAATNVAKAISDQKAERGIVIDEYGVGSSIVANKYEGIICANVADEHSAKMTVRHNNTTIITLGSGLVGETLAAKLCEAFLKADYDGGRHQIRVDMVNKMC